MRKAQNLGFGPFFCLGQERVQRRRSRRKWPKAKRLRDGSGWREAPDQAFERSEKAQGRANSEPAHSPTRPCRAGQPQNKSRTI
ncbi:hypothetical protein SGRA_1795 [Saprospira grandis str. Lewin]|uniref:Uncharacterized protein n=1 Tax=Saprospira grandis (strain Lewin) TaxID=984262 RepID=H6KZE0_SAPGL|nr:hypothetical protein SGRA_1795 [Saprospira grandis str. Lewin]